jgi:uncharacterized membrane protein
LTGQARTSHVDMAAAPSAPRWARLGSLSLAVAGLAVSAYLTVEHYSSSTTLACPETGVINCVKVTTSSYSKLAGVPVALLGLLFFVAMTALCAPPAWRAAGAWVGRARLGAAVAGVAMVVYLVWAELFRIDAICLWCTVVHALTVALFALLVLVAALRPIEVGPQ